MLLIYQIYFIIINFKNIFLKVINKNIYIHNIYQELIKEK